ncbi:hypothetical protein, partial [Enterobacter cloacae]|uniref:hypothetical protein n=1 Tax=Enterobacter cloacae TaxID=550 RepID=UPI001952EB7F
IVARDPFHAAERSGNRPRTAGRAPRWNGSTALPFHRHRPISKEASMPRGDKSKYTDKQERKADHIAESYEQR